MEKMFKNDMMQAYVSPSVIELHVASEGILCASNGTESLKTNDGSWSDLQ